MATNPDRASYFPASRPRPVGAIRRGIQRCARSRSGDAVGLQLPPGIQTWTARGLDLLRNTRNQLRYDAKQIGSAESDNAIRVATEFWPAHARHFRRGTATGRSEQVVVPVDPELQGSGTREGVHPGHGRDHQLRCGDGSDRHSAPAQFNDGPLALSRRRPRVPPGIPSSWRCW